MSGKETVNREILRLALPAIVSNITTPLLGLVDTAITGHLGAASYIGAIAVGGSMFSMAYWLMAFLRMGTSGLTAQAYGRDPQGAETQQVLWRAMLVSAAMSALLIVASPLLATALLAFMEADPETTALARQYFLIVIFGAPAVLGTYSLSGWFLGMQDSRAPMWMALVTNVANIAISLVLVFGFSLSIIGVAVGTLTAQWIGFGVGMAIGVRRFGIFRIFAEGVKEAVREQLLDRGQIKRFFSINADIFLRTLCLVAVTLWFTRSGAQVSAEMLAANALLMQLFILFSYFMDGFAFAGEALAGKYWGMGSRAMLDKVIKGVFLWGAGVACVFTAFYLTCGDWMLTMLTDDYGVADTARQYLVWAIAVPFAGVAAFVWDGIFIGLTLTRYMLVSIFISALVYFALYFMLHPLLGNHGLWIAFLAYLLTRGIAQSLLYAMRKS